MDYDFDDYGNVTVDEDVVDVDVVMQNITNTNRAILMANDTLSNATNEYPMVLEPRSDVGNVGLAGSVRSSINNLLMGPYGYLLVLIAGMIAGNSYLLYI